MKYCLDILINTIVDITFRYFSLSTRRYKTAWNSIIFKFLEADFQFWFQQGLSIYRPMKKRWITFVQKVNGLKIIKIDAHWDS